MTTTPLKTISIPSSKIGRCADTAIVPLPPDYARAVFSSNLFIRPVLLIQQPLSAAQLHNPPLDCSHEGYKISSDRPYIAIFARTPHANCKFPQFASHAIGVVAAVALANENRVVFRES
jgi:hypothetical protein